MGRRKLRKLDGILLLDKPLGVSSNRALQDVRFLFGAEKAGHTGSLDPLASGMLPVCFGESTKVSGFLLDSDKRYLTTAALGMVSTTGDAEGEKIPVNPGAIITHEQLTAALEQFRGEISQVPPMYSALKKDGQPLYKLARQGLEVERNARKVSILQLDLLEQTADSLSLDVCCSKGTYIRTLVEDIGDVLGCGAYVSSLRRTAVSPFQGFPMFTIEALRALAEQGQEALDAVLLATDTALQAFPAVQLDNAQVLRIRQGQSVVLPSSEPDLVMRLYDEDSVFIGLGEVKADVLRAKRLMAY